MTNDLFKVAEDSARSSFFLISGTALSTVILAIGSILTGRFLGPELYGQYTLALVIPSLLLTFTDLGISQGITKFTASLKAKGETWYFTVIPKRRNRLWNASNVNQCYNTKQPTFHQQRYNNT
jgi:hypothetical protein